MPMHTRANKHMQKSNAWEQDVIHQHFSILTRPAPKQLNYHNAQLLSITMLGSDHLKFLNMQ
uniref:Uncharacterized protein n=1 Tax=Arundo donax TaxID=35708 RepID=A0A0A9HI42_ARUDO